MRYKFIASFRDNVNLHKNGSKQELDEEFKQKLCNELDVEMDISEFRSIHEAEPYVSFVGKFGLSQDELYEKFGNGGLTGIVGDVAEDVYGAEATRVLME